MITWILGTILIIFVLIKRFSKDGRIEGYPLGMPRGTVRAIITLMVVSFPFNYLLGIPSTEIPSAIVNSIFILVAFYFEARRSDNDLLDLIKTVKNPEKQAKIKRELKKPLYLPKYSVRAMLVIILVSFIILNFYVGIPFESTNSIMDIVIIISFYFVGSVFRTFTHKLQKKKIKKQMQTVSDYQSLSKYEILEKIMEQEPSFWKKTWKGVISILTFVAVSTGLILYTLNIPPISIDLVIFKPSLREALLLLINVYYGFRD